MSGIIAYIYRPKRGDSSNGGISSRCDEVTVTGIGAENFEATEERPAVRLVKRTIGGATVVHAEPAGDRPPGGWMFGGSFISTCDGRFGRAVGFYGALAFHDRNEPPSEGRKA